ncbi:hypothetical protein AHF37_12624 [Paragonimus kellicotti]|nr:hypothetical protein AHF37_12624 [Paragonimus kellicotti]
MATASLPLIVMFLLRPGFGQNRSYNHTPSGLIASSMHFTWSMWVEQLIVHKPLILCTCAVPFLFCSL